LTIARQFVRVFDCRRAPCKGDGRNQANRHDARISHRQACAVSNLRRVPLFQSQSSFPGRRWLSAGSVARVPAAEVDAVVIKSVHEHVRSEPAIDDPFHDRDSHRPR
jgi:hypothetical protein